MRKVIATAMTCCVTAMATAAIGPGDDAPRHPPAPPAVPGQTSGLPDGYEILLARSIFAPQVTAAAGAHGRAPGPSLAPESAFAFRGVSEQGEHFTALVEDTSSGKTVPLRTGDPIARGRITQVTLHTLEYETAGKIRRVEVGQTLSGTDLPVAVAPAAADAAPAQPRPALVSRYHKPRYR